MNCIAMVVIEIIRAQHNMLNDQIKYPGTDIKNLVFSLYFNKDQVMQTMVQFQIIAETYFGENIFVIGTDKSLGCWNV